MKKGVVTLLMLLVVSVFAPFVHAVEEDEGPAGMAKYFSEELAIFMAMRVDEGYVDELNTVVNQVLSNIPADANLPIPANLDINVLLQSALIGTPFTYSDIRGFLGDYIALGATDIGSLSTQNLADSGLVIALSLKDSDAFTRFLEQFLPLSDPIETGNFSVYQLGTSFLAISPEVALFTTSLSSILRGSQA